MNCLYSSGFGLHFLGHRCGRVIHGDLVGLDVAWAIIIGHHGYGDMGRYTGVENINMRSIDFDIFHYNHEFGNAYSDMKRIVLHWSKPLE